MAPLILTLGIDPEAQAHFNTLRKRHFPPERNFLDAHLTLFHHLPPTDPEIIDTIQNICSQQSLLQLEASKVVGIGKGVAIKIECAPLQQIHRKLRQQWLPLLQPQDRQGIWPHITVQNKVSPQEAAALQQQLAAAFTPFTFWGIGLTLWEYLGGPWRLLQQYPFNGEKPTQNAVTV